MFFCKNKENYLKHLIHYLSTYQSIFLSSSKELKEINDYCSQRFNIEYATDKTCLMQIKNLFEKFEYIEKYIDVTLTFYKEKDNATKQK